MYFDLNINLSCCRDFNEIIQAHDRVYSSDPETAQLGCEQIFSWLTKSPKSQPLFEITAVICNALLLNSKDALIDNKLRSFFQSIKFLSNRILPEFPSNYEYYQYLSEYAYCEDGYLPEKEDLLKFSSSLFAYLNDNFWIPNIKIYQTHINDTAKSISDYFETEETLNISKSNLLFYFMPLLVKEFCKDCKGEAEEEELIFGFGRFELMDKFPKFISNAIGFTDITFADSFAFEFTDYLIQGSVWASKVLDMLFANKLCDTKSISNYILCAPEKNQVVVDFLKNHNIQTDEPNNNFWYGTPMGIAPYQFDSNNLDIDSSLVAILHEERRNTNNYHNKNSNRPSNSSNPSRIRHDQDQRPNSIQDNNNNNDNKNTHPNNNKPVATFSPNRIPQDQNQGQRNTNKNSNSNVTKITITTEKPTEKKLLITKPPKK